MTDEKLIDFIYNEWNGVYDKELIAVLLEEWKSVED